MQARDHPALADRLSAARRQAAELPARGTRGRAAYLDAIDGMVWGDGRAQGFVRGRSFAHPRLGFAFDAPPGYALVNGPDAVVASGPRGATFVLDSLPDPGGSPEAYLLNTWVPEIGRDMRTGRVEAARRTEVSGLAAAQARVALSARGSARTAELTVVRLGGRLYRLTGLRLPDDAAAASALAAAAASFRPLSAAEAARLQPLRIRIHRVAQGEDVAALAEAMPVGAAARARFDLLNGLRPSDGLRVGDEVKLVGE
jgi:predicted Zn-dependent protease